MADPKSYEPYVDATVIAQHLGCTKDHILRQAREKRIPGHPIGRGRRRRHWRFKISEVEKALAQPSALDVSCDTLSAQRTPATPKKGESEQ
jgi:excisionase family DNA binding protein